MSPLTRRLALVPALLVGLTACSAPAPDVEPAATAKVTGCEAFAGLDGERLGSALERARGLSTFASILRELDAVSSLDSIENATVFAPSDQAFDKLPPAAREALLADPARLGELVSAHVAGPRTTSNRFGKVKLQSFLLDRITVSGTRVNETADIVCADRTAGKAVVHVIDTLLVVP